MSIGRRAAVLLALAELPAASAAAQQGPPVAAVVLDRAAGVTPGLSYAVRGLLSAGGWTVADDRGIAAARATAAPGRALDDRAALWLRAQLGVTRLIVVDAAAAQPGGPVALHFAAYDAFPIAAREATVPAANLVATVLGMISALPPAGAPPAGTAAAQPGGVPPPVPTAPPPVAVAPPAAAPPPAESEETVLVRRHRPPWYFWAGLATFTLGYLPTIVMPIVWGDYNPNASAAGRWPVAGPFLVRNTIDDYDMYAKGWSAITLTDAALQLAGVAGLVAGGVVWGLGTEVAEVRPKPEPKVSVRPILSPGLTGVALSW